MAEKKVANVIKLQIPAGAANPAPPVGPALGAAGVNIMQFCQAFNAETQDKKGDIIPVEISVYEDKSFSFITKTPPAAHLIKKELNLKSGSAKPQAICSYLEGTFTEEKKQAWDERLKTVFNRGFWNGYYLGQRLGEWSKNYGSEATERKVYVGKGIKYFSNIGVAELDRKSVV